MPFEPTTVDHLGLQLYGTLPPVISELVSNAYDAESSRVEITLPKGRITDGAEVILRDFGHGLTPDEVQDQFLPIGRARRGENGRAVMSRNGKVRVTGRKGLGKLSAFGVATEVEARFIHRGNAICLRLNYDDLRSWPAKHNNRDYEPEVVTARSGPTKDRDGAEVRLRKLRRRRGISADEVRRGLARRLNFIGPKFVVVVNGTEIKPGDRVRRKDCAKGFRGMWGRCRVQANWQPVIQFPVGSVSCRKARRSSEVLMFSRMARLPSSAASLIFQARTRSSLVPTLSVRCTRTA